MAVEYYVMIAGRPNVLGSMVGLVAAESPEEADHMTKADYRENYKLDSSVHIRTGIAFCSEDEEEAIAFHKRLIDKIEEATNE